MTAERGATHDDAPDRDPEISAKQRCIDYGHVVRDHELLGPSCIRCGLFDPAWRRTEEGCWR